MQYKRIFLPSVFSLAIATVFTACSHDSAEHYEHSIDHASVSRPEIKLNDGAKWQMDEHTRAMIKSMSDKVAASSDAKTLGAALQGDLDKLIQGCTMQGDAHDQLHIFLMAYIPAVKELTLTSSPESQEHVNILLADYPNYFE